MPQIDKEKCMACGQCVEACTGEAIDIDMSRKKTGCYLNYVIDQKLCVNCGECLKVDCPGGAIYNKKDWISVRDKLPVLESGVYAKKYIVCYRDPITGGKSQDMSYFWKKGTILNGKVDDKFDLPDVTHWMEQPEFPDE